MKAYRLAMGLVASLVILSASVPVFAAGGEDMGTPYGDGMLRKLGRGIANVATCPAEIVRTSSIVGREEGVFAELTTGVLKGLGRGVVRGVTGIFEVCTFFIEIPKGFEPLMKPEYVWANGGWVE